uniref:Uncharacterized protein n=1 Tax=Ascaris lumbricoides TaxID=6252 RepID=A0A0M3IGN2_ASCLU
MFHRKRRGLITSLLGEELSSFVQLYYSPLALREVCSLR